MNVTMKEVARRCGLSPGAVSQVIRNPDHPRFTPATRKLILETASAMGYHQNSLSLALRTNKTKLIGLMLPWNEPEVMDSLERIASENGYKLLIQFTAHPRAGIEQESLQAFLNWNVDGIIWEPSTSCHDAILPLLNRVEKSDLPLVMLERGVTGTRFPAIQTDYMPAFHACVAHLKRQNYRNIVFIISGEYNHIHDPQRMAIEHACQQHGLSFRVFLVDKCIVRDQMRHLLSTEWRQDSAFICYSWYAVDFVETMESLGLSAPTELGIVIFQDMLLGGRFHVSSLLRPKLTAVRSQSARLASDAIRLLLARMRKEDFPQEYSLQHHAEFFVGQSTNRTGESMAE